MQKGKLLLVHYRIFQSAILNARAPKVGPRMNYSVARVLPTIVSFANPENYRKLKKEELLLECTQVLNEMVLTESSIEYLAEVTKLQADSLLWFQLRKGRLTASQFGAVCRTSVTRPSESLLDRILQKKSISVKVPSLEWGRTNEPVAKEAYISLVQPKHII